MTDYFSDRERGPRARTTSELGAPAWGGIVALIENHIANGGLGIDFPCQCPDGRGTTGTNTHLFSLALRAEIPGIEWPLSVQTVPDTLAVLDLLEFCHRHVAHPIEGSYHSFFDHTHLDFDRSQGQAGFRDRANRIFERNGVSFVLEDDGSVQRLAPPVFDEALRTAAFQTGDGTLDGLLEMARVKFLGVDPVVRREALEKIWDAWERLKTIELRFRAPEWLSGSLIGHPIFEAAEI